MDDGIWIFKTDIMNGEFSLMVSIMDNGTVDTTVIEKENDEEYVLYKTDASGTYVGEVREAIGNILNDIVIACFKTSVFKTEQAQKVIEYVRKIYGDELEFLWKKFPDNAVWCRKDSKKWYGAILTVPKNRLGLESDEIVEIIDLRLKSELMSGLMLKNTIILDGI